jgi:hypothetical protein
MTKVLILGNNPLPFEKTNYLSALGLRTWQLTKALLDEGHEVCLVCLRIPQAFADQELEPLIKKEKPFLYYSLDFATFTDPETLPHIMEEFNPDCLVATNLFPCYQAARLKGEKPFWADLHGHAMAEAQAKAAVDKDDQFQFILIIEHSFFGYSDLLLRNLLGSLLKSMKLLWRSLSEPMLQ